MAYPLASLGFGSNKMGRELLAHNLANGCAGSGCVQLQETYDYNNRLQPVRIQLGTSSDNAGWRIYNGVGVVRRVFEDTSAVARRARVKGERSERVARTAGFAVRVFSLAIRLKVS